MDQLLSVRIDSPEKTIWEGKATSVSSVNSQGPFDILPQHASFITIVEKTPLIIATDKGESLKFNFDRCVIHTHADNITVYTNIQGRTLEMPKQRGPQGPTLDKVGVRVKIKGMPALYSNKIFVPDGYYHVFNRGVNKSPLFLDDEDSLTFLSFFRTYLEEKTEEKLQRLPLDSPQRYLPQSINLLAYCLMPNHFHLVLKQSTKTAMTEFIRVIGTNYATYFNRKYHRVGTIFQGKYKAIIIDSEYYLLHLTRYVHLNPKELCSTETDPKEFLRKYMFSSYPDYLGLRTTKWLKPQAVTSYFSSHNFLKPTDINSYQSFVEDYLPNPKETLGRLTME